MKDIHSCGLYLSNKENSLLCGRKVQSHTVQNFGINSLKCPPPPSFFVYYTHFLLYFSTISVVSGNSLSNVFSIHAVAVYSRPLKQLSIGHQRNAGNPPQIGRRL